MSESVWIDREQAQLAIRGAIDSRKPFLASRIGSTEMKAMLRVNAVEKNSILQSLLTPLVERGLSSYFRLAQRKIARDSGFFPIDYRGLRDFFILAQEALSAVDLLGSWLRGEAAFYPQNVGQKMTKIEHLEPFFSHNPWTASLENKRVLVVHPFVTSITRQYEQRELLFPDRPSVLPRFSLICLAPPQTLGGKSADFESWFDGLLRTYAEAMALNFDVAIVSAGSYGLPLSYWLKTEGYPVVHLGGVTQLMFGIRGKRWESSPQHRGLFNSSWVRPLPEERPIGRNLGTSSYW